MQKYDKGDLFIIGVTGSIAMGKSTIAQSFSDVGILVQDADKEAHKLLEKGGQAVSEILKYFLDVGDIKTGIDRKKLSRHVFNNPDNLRIIEKIMHPIIQAARQEFYENAKKYYQQMGTSPPHIVVIDVPLLFEKNIHKECDLTILASAPPAIQKKRALARPNMDKEKLKHILKNQMPDEDKRKLADIIIDTSKDPSNLAPIVQEILNKIR
jgi:dephospho-CoA kinase